MPRRTTFIAVLVAGTICIGSAAPLARAAATTYYVAVDGRDANVGSTSAPFRSIQRAAEAAQAGDGVVIRAGTYREHVTPPRSGREGAPITFQADANATVVVSGANLVDQSAWQRDGDRWYVPWTAAYTSATNQSDQVFVDGVMLNEARWPEEQNHDRSHPFVAHADSVVSAEKTTKTAPGAGYAIYRITFADSAFDEPDGRWVGARIWINTGGATSEQDGNGQTGTVITTNRAQHQITVEVDASAASGSATPSNFQFGNGSGYYLFNPPHPDGLQHNGEFWHDTRQGRLYLRTPDGSAPGSHAVEVKQRDFAFDLDSRSYITIKNLAIFAASITTDAAAGNGVGNGGNRSASVASANHIVLDHLRASYVSHFSDQTGNLQTQWAQASGILLSGTANTIQNSEIAWSAGNGLVVIGQGSIVRNNRIHDTNYTAAEGGGINLGRTTDMISDDHDVGYNTVYNSGIEGIEFSALRNSSGTKATINARIHHNIVHDTVLQSADSGGIKAFASDGGWARIDHNLIYNIGGTDQANKYVYFGIYLDFPEKDGQYIIDHNVVYNTPTSLNINGMKNVEVLNNTFIARPEVARAPITANGTLENVAVRNTISNRALRIPTSGVTLSNNLLPQGDSEDTSAMLRPWFVDPNNADQARRDYMLTSMATPAIDTGTDVAPFNDATPPDIGAYEFGQPRWQAGATLVAPTPCGAATARVVQRVIAIADAPYHTMLPLLAKAGTATPC